MQGKYNHLSFEERINIKAWMIEKTSIREIARRLDRDPSTISRELRRNKAPISEVYTNYIARAAHVKSIKRRKREYRKIERVLLKTKANQKYVEAKLILGWSPELIAGRMRRDKAKRSVSHEAIYQWLYKERPDLLMVLPRHHKTRKKRGQSKRHPLKYNDAPGLDKRTTKIINRSQFGHWESDSMTSDQSLTAIHVVVERKTRYVVISKLRRNRGFEVKAVLLSKMGRLPKKARISFTYDRGPENCKYNEISKRLNSNTYFCSAYRGWEKGTVENTIGIIRRTIKKRTDLGRFSFTEIRKLQSRLNNRPRKCLDFQTASEVFKKELVALRP